MKVGMKTTMYNVIGIHKTNRKRILIEPNLSEAQALKMCEAWGWIYNDGTDNGEYWLSMERVGTAMETEYEYEVTYTECYSGTYRVKAKSKDEAKDKVEQGIINGTLEPPNECYDSNYYVVEVR